jgi:predicted Zn-dependent protease
MGLRENLESMLAAGNDTALLRFTLGTECLKVGEVSEAAIHLRSAVELDPKYSAAWKLLGRALDAAGDTAGAKDAWTRGRAAAEHAGDVQASKEMSVFLRRLDKRLAADEGEESLR